MTGTGVKQLPDTQVNFSPFKEFTLVLLDPELTLVLLIPFHNYSLRFIFGIFNMLNVFMGFDIVASYSIFTFSLI